MKERLSIGVALAVIDRLHDDDTARQVATWAGYDWHADSAWDPFAGIYNLA